MIEIDRKGLVFRNIFVNAPNVSYTYNTPRISPSMNEALISPTTAEEIREAAVAIHAGKASGSDGFSSDFFHSFWKVIGPDVIKKIKLFFYSGVLLPHLNKTHVQLIPKGLSQGKWRTANLLLYATCSTRL